MRTCLGCCDELLKRSQRTCCSVACQQVARQQLAAEAWLSSGTAFPGTHPRHDVRHHLAEEQRHRCAICGLPEEWEERPLCLVGRLTRRQRYAQGQSY